MGDPDPRAPRRLRLPWLAVAVAALILLRFRHLGEVLDGPHSGRQCDTAFYATDFYRHGIHLLRPSVCWMGGYKAVALEFPLPEAAMALAYHALGHKLLWARLLVLLCFLGSAWYLYRIVQYVRNARVAAVATVLYLAMPLAQAYSRAVHVDFTAVFVAHAMLYYFLRGYDEERTGLIALGSAFAVLAFLIKAPYAFYLFLPFGLHALARPKFRALAKWAPLFALPLVAFALWRWHVTRLNAAAPDWSFIPGYFKFTDMGWWYYGPMSLRLSVGTWVSLAQRTLHVTCGTLGLYFLILGLVLRPSEGRGMHFFRLWLAGVVAYVAIFFNLNVIHDYYQIPFLAPVAFFVAAALEWLFLERLPAQGLRAAVPFGLTVALLLGSYVRTAEAEYYTVDSVAVSAGERIRENTPQEALVIGALGRKIAWWFDARLLQRADRCGWAIRVSDLNETNIRALIPEGATHLAIVADQPVRADLAELLKTSPCRSFELADPAWRLHLYRLDPALARPAPR